MRKILFLEDEKMIREVLSEYMRVADYEVTECENGIDAIRFIHTKDFDLAVLDIRVPGKSGLEVLQEIRNSEQKNMGVLMLTAYEDISTQVEAFNFFADDYIIKPTSPILLLKRMEVLLHRIHKDSPEKDKGLFVDIPGYQAFYQGKNLNLTLTEFLLLKTLQSQPGRVFNREQLLNQLFHDEYDGSDRMVDVHIKNLRKKLPLKWIETVIGVGYRWKEKANETEK